MKPRINFTQFNIRDHKVVSLILIIISFIFTFRYVQQYEYLQYVDSYRWMLFDDSAWGELSPTLSLLEKGEILWGYLYFDITQRAHALWVTPLIMFPFIKFLGIYPGIMLVRALFLIMGSFVPVFIYGTSYRLFGSKKAAFISGLLIAIEPLILQYVTYISRHPPSIFFFAFSLFLVTKFIFGQQDKRTIMLSLLTGFSLGASTVSDGDGIGIVLIFILSVIFLQIKKKETGFRFYIDSKLIFHALLIVVMAVSIYSTSIIRNHRNLGLFAPSWTASMHLAYSNNDKIAEIARKGETLFQECYVSWEPEKPVYGPTISKKFQMKIFPEYEYHMIFMSFFKNWVKNHPFEFLNILVKRFYQNITIYYSWLSTAIAISAFISLFFWKPYIYRNLYLLTIWFVSGFMFSLIYLTFWHQMHQVMVLSVFSGFAIVKLSDFLNAKSEKIKVSFLKKTPTRKMFFLFLTLFILITISYIIKIRIMKDPMVLHETGRFGMYKLPVMADSAFKNDYKDIKTELPEDVLLITQRNPFLVNKIIQRDILLSKLGYQFDPYGPENLQNGWLITTPKGWIYRFRENADYLPMAADYTYNAISSGRTVIADFDPNIDKLRFFSKEFFSGKKVRFYILDILDKVIHVDGRWRAKYDTINLTSHPNVIEIKGTVNTTNPEYIFSIIDDLDASVTFMFEADKGHVIEHANLYISINCSSPVDSVIQVSADGKRWADIPLKADPGYTNKSVSLGGTIFNDRVYTRFFQDRFSNMHIKNFELGMKYKNN